MIRGAFKARDIRQMQYWLLCIYCQQVYSKSLSIVYLISASDCDKLRLVGPTQCSGRVEILHRERWGTVCDDYWSLENADVVCKELNCGTALEAKRRAFFGEGKEQIWLDDVQCTGHESALTKCQHREFGDNNCGHGEDAGVVCSDSKPLRLVNGTNRCSGRVEIYHDGQWGTVCDDRWGMQEAAVTCREMNCGAPLAVKYRGHFGHGEDQVWMDDVECTGKEKSLTQCPHRGFGENDCDHSEDAGVICSDTLRLVNGTDLCSGRVEVHIDGQWGKVCASQWTTKEAELVCKELDCGKPRNDPDRSHFGQNKGLRAYTSTCTGSETSLGQCTFHPSEGCEDAVVSCSDLLTLEGLSSGNPQIKLVNGTDQCSGRVEIHHDGQWGTVCDDHWDIRDAQVVCKELDCGTALAAKPLAYFGKGVGEIWLDDVECFGNETSLLHCQKSTFGDNNCGHSEDAGVVCSSSLRLINGSDHCSGRLEVNHGGYWYPVFNVNWGRHEAQVVCREMSCGDPVMASGSFGQGSAQRGYIIACGGMESSLSQCSLREFVKNSNNPVGDAAVTCTGNVKLVNGSNSCSGRVEFYHNGQWGTVCSSSWDVSDAMVVCRQLNCGRAHKINHDGFFGYGSGNIWVDETECNGQESLLTQCPQRQHGHNTCNSTSIAGVICSGNKKFRTRQSGHSCNNLLIYFYSIVSLEVRLVNSADHCSGRVEVHHAGQWGTVCERDWSLNKAEMICSLLECGHAVSAPGGAHFGQGSGAIWEASESCFANETSFQQCLVKGLHRASCGHEEDASVVCAGKDVGLLALGIPVPPFENHWSSTHSRKHTCKRLQTHMQTHMHAHTRIHTSTNVFCLTVHQFS
uniref:Soluble scavenger receptor cysteine-rich domain-containing protein SSC5D n=1 Tax=Myripristis murdjan TaxID=586833 RepID=A0A667X2E3_9TELE